MPPALDLARERALQRLIVQLIRRGVVQSAHDCAEGGLAVTVAECTFDSGGHRRGRSTCRRRVRPGRFRPRPPCSASRPPGSSFRCAGASRGRARRRAGAAGVPAGVDWHDGRRSHPALGELVRWRCETSVGGSRNGVGRRPSSGTMARRKSGEVGSPLTSRARRGLTDGPQARPELLMFDKLHEACGVFGIFGHTEASKLAYLGLYALQHRGQESAGVASVRRHEGAAGPQDGPRRGHLRRGHAGRAARPHRHRPYPLLHRR